MSHPRAATAHTIPGSFPQYTVLGDMWVFDGDQQVWRAVNTTAPPPPRWGASAVCSGTTITVFGGFTDMVNASSGDSAVNEVWQLDLPTWTWSLANTSDPPSPRGLVSAACVNGIMYAVSGTDMAGISDAIGGTAGTIFTSMWALDLHVLQWQLLNSSFVENFTIPTILPARDPSKLIAFYTILSAVLSVGYFDIPSRQWEWLALSPINTAPPGQSNPIMVPCSGFFLLLNVRGLDVLADVFVLIGCRRHHVHVPRVQQLVVHRRAERLSAAALRRHRQHPQHHHDHLRCCSARTASRLTSAGGSGNNILNDLWLIDMYTGLRRQINPAGDWPAARYFHAAIVINSTMFMFGGASYVGLAMNDCWSLDIKAATWTKLSCIDPPSPCGGMTLAPINSSSLMLFSGFLADGTTANETFIWDLNTHAWTEVVTTLAPPPRAFYSMARLSSDAIVLFGGGGLYTSNAPADVWSFDTQAMQWRKLPLTTDSFEPQPRSFQGTTTVGCKKLFVIGGRLEPLAATATAEVLVGNVVNNSQWAWQLLQAQGLEGRYSLTANVALQSDDACIHDHEPVFPPALGVMIFATFGVNMLGETIAQGMLQTLNPGCNPGFYANTSTAICQPCPVGTYAGSSGASACTPCATGSTTNSTGSTAVQQCDACENDYCHNGGTCVVTAYNEAPTCQCVIWLLDPNSQCASLTSYGIATISVVFGLVAMLVVYCVARGRWHRLLAANSTLQDQLVEQEKAFESSWKIENSEITLQRKIGQGGFGEVWVGLWGDRPVAVKKLLKSSDGIDDDDNLLPLADAHRGLLSDLELTSRAKAEFEEEIKLIRRIKHINIVLCFGAGKAPDGSLFLVLEFCSRGSLQSILADASIEWHRLRQLEIALHAARGIQFLHGMKPISIHRDIKSPNVLVSDGWIAKISDFGSAKLVEVDDGAKGKRRGNTVRHETHAGGSLLWSAPEVFRHQPCTTRSDVYRCIVTSDCSSTHMHAALAWCCGRSRRASCPSLKSASTARLRMLWWRAAGLCCPALRRQATAPWSPRAGTTTQPSARPSTTSCGSWSC